SHERREASRSLSAERGNQSALCGVSGEGKILIGGGEGMLAVKANGAVIPIVGLGTWDVRGKTCSRIVEQALRLGYRHIDTAQVYENEREVGEGVRASGIAREQVFVTTKVWWTHFSSGELERSVAESLARLKLGYVDLLLLHWPNASVPLSETVAALCKVKREGLARHVGVSNFTVA